MTLNNYTVKFIHIYVLWPAVSELQAFLWQAHWMTPKSPWTLQVQRYPLYVLLVSQSPKCLSISLCGQAFLTKRPLWNKCTEWPQHYPERYNVKGTHVCALVVSLSAKFQSVSLQPAVFSYRPFWDKYAPYDPKMTLNTTRAKVHHISATNVPESQIWLGFAPWPAVF